MPSSRAYGPSSGDHSSAPGVRDVLVAVLKAASYQAEQALGQLMVASVGRCNSESQQIDKQQMEEQLSALIFEGSATIGSASGAIR